MSNRQNPSLGFTNEIQRNASNTFGIRSAAGAVDEMSKVDTKQLSKLHSGFTVRVCSLLSVAKESSLYNTTILSTAGSCVVLLQFKGKPRRHITHKHSSTSGYT